MAEETHSPWIARAVDQLLPQLQDLPIDRLEQVAERALQPEPSSTYDLHWHLPVLGTGLGDRSSSGRGRTRALARAKRLLRRVICDAANKKIIDGSLNAANVGSVATIVLPELGGLGTGHSTGSAPAVCLAVLILRIGLNEFCKDPSQQLEQPTLTPTALPKASRPRKRKKSPPPK